MSIWEVVLLSAALSMDACAVGMTNGMLEPKMRAGKGVFTAFAYGFFQFFMPVLGFYGSSVLSGALSAIAPYLSFGVLAFLGGKMIFDTFRKEKPRAKALDVGKLFLQAIATSIDALAVGVAFLAISAGGGLPAHPVECCALIGVVTFLLSAVSVEIGKRAGDKLADRAEFSGGAILLVIGLKILLEAFF